MNRLAPTLDQIRRSAHKPRHRREGSWLARHIGRPVAVYGTWLALRLGLSAHVVTALALVADLAGAIVLSTGTRLGFCVGVAWFWLGYLLDHVDGQVARYRREASLSGAAFDFWMHHVSVPCVGFAVGMSMAMQTGEVLWSALGFVMGLSLLWLRLHDDCRYKAFFQRLNAAPDHYQLRVTGSARVSTNPAVRFKTYRARLAACLLWPCEPHAVLMGLSGLVVLAFARPSLWSVGLPVMLIGYASLGLIASTIRLIRTLAQSRVDREFSNWFVTLEEGSEVRRAS